MDIERVNDYTLKLYISYDDIEERGYSREEIWYNRGKGEQLFWDMIEEIGEEADFELEGAVWIHVNAAETGIEVVVTRTSEKEDISGHSSESEGDPFNFEKMMEQALIPEQDEQRNMRDIQELLKDKDYAMFKLGEFDDVIGIAKRLAQFDLHTTLYKYEGKYYFSFEKGQHDQAYMFNAIATVQEFATLSAMSTYYLREYGEVIMDGNCIETVQQYFA
ncbi:adaptor protein MecA [Caryophanon tenue]|uniref:Adapter protein MecA n=1 Tax=Caryophanon tenue TaxID=33978 RepID=A0A1C0YJW1_9BACL|nr:adaptor protein MecA [Caryophanon tenue]OCS87466.1 hypothetical protein A6M13_09145 [Caryophanon tenue]